MTATTTTTTTTTTNFRCEPLHCNDDHRKFEIGHPNIRCGRLPSNGSHRKFGVVRGATGVGR